MPDPKKDSSATDTEAMPATEKEKALSIRVNDDITGFLTDFEKEIQKAVNGRTSWSRQLRDNYSWRKGQVGRPFPNLPFKDSADIRYRRSEAIIKKLKPAGVSAVMDAPKITRYVAIDPGKHESADRCEVFNDFLYRSGVLVERFDQTVTCAYDQALECGKTVVKVTWEQRRVPDTGRYLWKECDALHKQAQQKKVQSMEPLLKAAVATVQKLDPAEVELTDEEFKAFLTDWFKYDPENDTDRERVDSIVSQYHSKADVILVVRDRIINRPVIQEVQNLQDIVVPTNSGPISEAPWVDHEFLMSEDELRADAVENGGIYENVDELLDTVRSVFESDRDMTWNQEWKDMEIVRARAEGLTSYQEIKGFIRIRELYCWMKRKFIPRWKGEAGGGNVSVRVVITYAADMPVGMIPPLRVIEFPYDHNEWPFADYTRNMSSRRYYSGEGVPEEVNSFEREENITRNASLNRVYIGMSPPVLHYSRAKIDPSKFRQVGQAIETAIPPSESMYVPAYPDIWSHFDLKSQHFKVEAEEIAGVGSGTSLQNYATAPTAAQVEAAQQPSNAISAFELKQWLGMWGVVFRQVHSLCRQYLFDTIDGNEVKFPRNVQGGPTEYGSIKREDFDGQYIIVSGGDVTRNNPVLEAQKMFTHMQFATNNPMVTPFFKMYDEIQLWSTKLVGAQDTSIVMQPREAAEKLQAQVMQMAAGMAAQKMMGKQPRQPKIKQLPQAMGGMMPK